MKSYRIPAKTTLYRGFPEVKDRKPDSGNAFHFLTTNPLAAEDYGVVFPLTTDREYKLVALDDASTRESLYQNAPPEIKTILDENYALAGRDSVFANDVALSKYLCTLGKDGYAMRKMPNRDESRSDFHDELMFCDTSKLIVGETTSTDEEIVQIVNRMKDKVNARELRKKRRTKKRSLGEENKTSTTTGMTPKRLFEGGRGKSRCLRQRRRR